MSLLISDLLYDAVPDTTQLFKLVNLLMQSALKQVLYCMNVFPSIFVAHYPPLLGALVSTSSHPTKNFSSFLIYDWGQQCPFILWKQGSKIISKISQD